ncbi:uncharacterized protein stbd1 [Eucyclogobius newberryi]|uniref:uncharacterized protein stbd1 n=1 Tax=Eucyclogobius newberryi TaxID=166745 RepID=UPI003B5939F0
MSAVPVILFAPISVTHLRQFAAAAAALRSNKRSVLFSKRLSLSAWELRDAAPPNHPHPLPLPLLLPLLPRRPRTSRGITGGDMPLRKTVAMERRIDLASLFCMIARHGPAVLLALAAFGCLVAGFVFIKNVKEKRRRRKRAAERRDSDAGHEDAVLGPEEVEEEAPGRAARSGSTDASDESSQDDVKEQTHRSHEQVRQRRPSSERKQHKHKVPYRDAAVDKAQHAFFWEWNSHRTQSSAEEPVQNFELKLEEDVVQEDHGAKEPELIKEEEEEKMPEADSSEDLTTTNEDVSEGEFRQEESVQFSSDSQSCSCPTPDLSDQKESTRETNSRHLEIELEDGNAPVLVKENISSAPHKEDKDDQENITNEQNLENEDKSRCLNDEKQADETVSATPSVEVKEEHLLVAGQKSEAEPSKPEETKDDFKPSDTSDLSPVDSEQSDKQNDQSGHCPQEQSHNTTEIQSDKGLSTSQTDTEMVNNMKESVDSGDSINTSIADAIPHIPDVNVAEKESVVDQVILPENTSLQGQQSQEIASNKLNDQKDWTEEEQTAPICKLTDSNVVDCTEIQSSSIDSKQVECLAPPTPSPNQFSEVLDEETSQFGLPADVKAEILSITDTTAPSNNQEKPGMTHSLDTELDNESKQAAKEESTDTTETSIATLNDKVDCIVEQIVADAYKEFKKTSLEPKSVQLEQSSLVQQDSVDDENVASDALENDTGKVSRQEESKEVVFCSNMAAQITEEVVNTVCSLELSNLKDVKSERQKDIEISVAPSQMDIDSNDMPMVKTVLHAQEINQGKEEKVDQETPNIAGNEGSIPLGDDKRLLQPAIEVKSLHMDKNGSSEQIVVQPVPDKVCSNVDTQIQAVKSDTVSCLEVVNLEKVEGEILSGTKIETVENVVTSIEKCQQKFPEMLEDVDVEQPKTESAVGQCLFLEKGKDQEDEIQPVIKTEILENATSTEVQTKEPGMSSDANNDKSISIEKVDRKVVIVCRTVESSVSAVEISDSEDSDGQTSHLELKKDYLGNKATPTNEGFSVDIAASSDTLAAETPIDETTPQETCSNSDLTSGAALDICQDTAADMKSMEQTKLKENGISSPCLESGICSMTVSPEMEVAGEEIGQIIVGHFPLSQNASREVFHDEENVSHSLYTSNGDDKEDAVSMVVGPLASSPVQLSAPEDISNESLVTNEDSFGSEIEEDYQKAMEETMMEVVHDVNWDEMMKEEVKKVDMKKEQACVTNKEEAEKPEKPDSEKTDISIMEATMDHNEWIIDGSYQVLPWMNATNSKDAASSQQGVDLVENKPQPQTQCTEDGTESAKKVLAVQPMPQNVNVTFRVHYLPLSPYQTVAVTGDQQELGAWRSVVPLEKTEDGYWSCVVGLPAESHVEWKFVVLEKGEVRRWEECGNRLLYTGFGDDLLVQKWWGFL